MHFSIPVSSITLFAATAYAQATFPSSSKRGLVFVPNAAFPQDDQIWVQPNSDIGWYYNYMNITSPAFSRFPQSQLEFIPMIWGAPSDNSFVDSVTAMIKGGRNITHVLAFNEPDGPWSQGGSNMSVAAAVKGWKSQVEPLQSMGVKVSAPAVTQRGLGWLAEFMTACQNCTIDFIPLHWYGNYSGLVDHVAKAHTAYPTTKLWITEYAYDHVTLQQSQDFFNTSAKLFDSTDYIERYSYFGAMRSNGSNVGPNAAFLTSDGKLTSIGSWYLGGAATNNIPSTASSTYAVGVKAVALGSLIVGWVGISLL